MRLARRLSHDSVGQRAGQSNLVEEAGGLGHADMAHQMVGLKRVAKHRLALRFHRFRERFVVAWTQHVANRLPGKAKLREFLTDVAARNVALVVFTENRIEADHFDLVVVERIDQLAQHHPRPWPLP